MMDHAAPAYHMTKKPLAFERFGYNLKAGATAERVVGAYHKIEDIVVSSYKKIEEKFVNEFLEEVDSDNK